MRKNFIPTNIFHYIYCVSNFDMIFISKEFARDRIFSQIRSNHPKEIAQVDKNLEYCYAVRDENSMYQAIFSHNDTEYKCVLLYLLYGAYKEFGNKL